MHFPLQSRFELSGTFEGFVRNKDGKRRMMFRAESGKVLELKVPKEIRRTFADQLREGMKIAVRGVEQFRLFGRPKRVVSFLRFLSPPLERKPCARCPIRICSKKNCWKNGGKQIWSHIESRLKEEGLTETVELKAVGCLGNCKRAPNLVYNRERHSRCSKADADAILAKIVSTRDSGTLTEENAGLKPQGRRDAEEIQKRGAETSLGS